MNTYEGILYLMVQEIWYQCRFAEYSYLRFVSALKEGTDKLKVFFYAQALVNAAAKISKVFWPSKKYFKRGEILRTDLGVGEDHFFQDRDLRNHIEHFDARIHQMYEEKMHPELGAEFLDMEIVQTDKVSQYYDFERHRVINSTTLEYHFYNERYPLAIMIEEIRELQVKAKDWLDELYHRSCGEDSLRPD